MKIYYDAEVDALYIELRSLAAGTAENRELSEDITANYGPDGKLAGLEILDASSVLGDIAFLFPLRYKSSTPNLLRKGLGGVVFVAHIIEKLYNFSKVIVELSPIVGTPKAESLVSK